MRLVGLWRVTQQRVLTPRLVGKRWISRSYPCCRDVNRDLIDRTRNIGIIAHIDAGKTTTTERMLYYSGYTRRIGDVDDGSTVTDFLPAERARGITIQSAAITFHWPPKDQVQESNSSHNINLIDTPGHADFTFEVLRSLRVLDGAICILDGVAGVEAQTEKVWAQANSYRIPRLIYVNKLDRDGAAFGKTVTEIGVRLHGWPAVCQIPWWAEGHSRLAGVGDVVSLRGLWWKEGGDGKDIQAFGLDSLKQRDEPFAAELIKARTALVELLSEHDDELVEQFLSHNEDHLAIPADEITAALRRCVNQSSQRVFPVFAGASFRNVGVQPLLDAVVSLLPSPVEKSSPEISLGSIKGSLQSLLRGDLSLDKTSKGEQGKNKKAVVRSVRPAFNVQNLEACALAFKVVHDARRGVLVYIRVYSGSVTRNAPLFNTNLGVTERAQRMYQMYASDAVEVQSIDAGQIGVIAGLKYARTGDTLLVYSGSRAKDGPPEPLNTLQLRPIEVPPPVFFTSVEAHSLSEEKHLNDSLELLLREDPSLSVSTDPESGQTHLSGMGELHLEIAGGRLLSDLKAKASIGAVEIGYREALTCVLDPITVLFDRESAGKRARAASMVSVGPLEEGEELSVEDREDATIYNLPENNTLTILHPTLTRHGKPASEGGASLPGQFSMTNVLSSIRNGVTAALARGPTYHFPVHSAHIEVQLDPPTQIFPDTTYAAISSAARLATHSALKGSVSINGSVLMEPVMLVTISVGEDDLGSVVHDLSSARGGQVLSLDTSSSSLAHGIDATSFMESEEELPIIDPTKIYRPTDPFEGSPSGKYSGTEYVVAPTRQRQIVARVPLKEMVGYLKYLRSLTGGRGTFVMKVDRFERMSMQRMKAVLAEMRGGSVT
ncbi:P-loop containing nucleoside triphosphate hydrolase protein [Rhizodiscina lignyota]|uniref:Ribosome-releasing factor 2, mitochondrial n=1 Tax=Rhizodiscina lignyota TaxID=1504668 RepID=A0A9P4IGN6_9PEZI|nr:P-loop containing nucleoside triphosphate hydrolase protein [Rhizodiscina lignyota]